MSEKEQLKTYEDYLQAKRDTRVNRLEIFQSPTKRKIFTTAIDLFAKNGYDNVSMRDLAEAVKIKTASIYNHFTCKRDILLAIFNTQFKMQYFYETKEELEEAIKIFSAKEVLSGMLKNVIIFEPEEADLFRKIIRIEVMEQYREPIAYASLTRYILVDLPQYYRNVFDALIKQEKMKPFNSACYAQIIASVNYSYIIEFSHYHGYLTSGPDTIPTLAEVKALIFELILN